MVLHVFKRQSYEKAVNKKFSSALNRRFLLPTEKGGKKLKGQNYVLSYRCVVFETIHNCIDNKTLNDGDAAG